MAFPEAAIPQTRKAMKGVDSQAHTASALQRAKRGYLG